MTVRPLHFNTCRYIRGHDAYVQQSLLLRHHFICFVEVKRILVHFYSKQGTVFACSFLRFTIKTSTSARFKWRKLCLTCWDGGLLSLFLDPAQSEMRATSFDTLYCRPCIIFLIKWYKNHSKPSSRINIQNLITFRYMAIYPSRTENKYVVLRHNLLFLFENL